jgi:hypothetical protein
MEDNKMNKYKELLVVLEQATDAHASFNRWISSGVASVSNVMPRQKYWTPSHEKRGPIGRTYASATGVPIGKYLARFFNNLTKGCESKCADTSCIVLCRIQATNQSIALIQRDMTQLAMIKDPDKRARLKSKLDSQMAIYQDKKRQFEANVY